ncbi:heme exporter protein CcmD [Methylobacterium sp. 4-46]|nr:MULTISPECIES: heme exporter protein CcmD [Methylobacterium]ACA18040.1 heme exporter protein CcmD [Methylobacterium sp. 4-46]WFT77342.1 heme exporter protein CcmD [Methylobacterium nodulans]
MDLGPHATFILASYAFTALVVAALILHAVLDFRAQRRALARLQDGRDA